MSGVRHQRPAGEISRPAGPDGHAASRSVNCGSRRRSSDATFNPADRALLDDLARQAAAARAQVATRAEAIIRAGDAGLRPNGWPESVLVPNDGLTQLAMPLGR